MNDRKQRDIKFFMVGVLIWLAMSSIIFLVGGCSSPATDIPPTEQVVGGDMDIHGCIATAGYQWCDSLEVCYRDWETDCPTKAEPADDVETPATPRQDLPEPTPTVWAFSTPSWEVDNEWPYGIPAMAIPIESTFDGPVKVYVLLGSDWMEHRENQDATDAIMLVLVDTESDTATVISVPRDLYVFIPSFGMGRINVAWSLGGFDTVKETIRYNLGLEVDGIVYGRIYALKKFIDQGLGGISVYVNWPIVERCGDLEINLSPGLVTMDGEYALCYARARMMTGDLDRMVRQQEILLAIKTRFLILAFNNPVEFAEMLYTVYVDAGFRTDISILDIPGLVLDALEIPETEFRFNRMRTPMLEHFDHPETGAWLWQMPTPDVIYDFFRIVLED